MPDADTAFPVIRAFAESDYQAVRALWDSTEGVGLSDADAPEAIAAFVARNQRLSLVAEADGRVVGSILVGHDGRRGFIHHLAVADSHRRTGLGRRLVAGGLAGLKRAGIGKCHALVFETNQGGQAFWTALGATRRDDLSVYSLTL